jgi:hypothetical protein
MERVTSKLGPLYVWTVVAALLSQNVMIHVMSTAIEDQKNYYSPEPHPPRGLFLSLPLTQIYTL